MRKDELLNKMKSEGSLLFLEQRGVGTTLKQRVLFFEDSGRGNRHLIHPTTFKSIRDMLCVSFKKVNSERVDNDLTISNFSGLIVETIFKLKK